MKFEWDEEKNKNNILKHNVNFNEAKTIFADKHLYTFTDDDHSINEDRFYAIGKSLYKNILLVVFCIRHGDTIRLISARMADKDDKEVYYARY